MPEYGGEASPGSHSEYLRALLPDPGNNPEPSSSTEKRRYPRYKCEGSVEFRTESIDVRTWATVTEISSSGCYVEMQATSQVGTRVDMVIELKGIRVRAKGVVKTSYPLLGMGIAFTEMTEAEQAQLDHLLLRLAGGSSPSELVPKSSPSLSGAPDLLMITDPAVALNAVAKFFQTHRALSSEEFTELLSQSQEQDREARR